jgi:tRNA-specific 2-thiouridylase
VGSSPTKRAIRYSSFPPLSYISFANLPVSAILLYVMDTSKKILVAMSGGVDSSVTAAILKQAGYSISGVTMQICDCEEAPSAAPSRHGCYGPGARQNIADARRVADYLGIPHHVLDLRAAFENLVLAEVVSGYRQGRTPNPCVYCNPRVKFGSMVETAKAAGLDFDRLSTGHYARVEHDPDSGRYILKKAADARKDQSYFLAFLDQAQLGMAVFPLGGYSKAQVRRIAAETGLPVSNKPESQDFVSGGYHSLLTDDMPSGPVVDKSGRVLGTHAGISRYTVGQHKGLDLPGQDKFYVIKIVPEENTVVVGTENDLMRRELIAGGLNWVAVMGLDVPMRAEVKIRSGAVASPAVIESQGGSVRVIFDGPQRGIAPGQAAVFYNGDTVLGAGIIDEVPD